tara:strand:+ start:1034 stop:1285 length:252 start_codon:yes stop_codon:yes gene_type:complete
MSLQIQPELIKSQKVSKDHSKLNEQAFSKDYVDFLNEAGWILERKLPSNITQYSDLLEDTEWKSNISKINSTIHYRRDLDALS